jgi:nucleoside-diphosphate-sugar epimerase
MILVTGASGFIGKHVCLALAAHNHKIVAVDRDMAGDLTCECVQGDLSQSDFLLQLFQAYSFDRIVHLASLLNTMSGKRPLEAMRVNVGSSLGLLKLAVEHPGTRFIYGSSISVYGSKRYQQYGEVTELEPASPEDVYGVSKRYVEIAGADYHHRKVLQFAALRIATVIGAGAAKTSSRWRSEIFEALAPGHPTEIHIPYQAGEVVPLIHVEEVARVIRTLVEADRMAYTVYNTPCETWSYGDLVGQVTSLNKDIKVVYGQSEVTGIPQVINGNRFIEEFGYRPVPLKERFTAALMDSKGHVD